MGIVNRFRKLNHDTSLSLGKVRIGGITLGLIFLLGIGGKLVARWSVLSPETALMVSQAMDFAVSLLFVSVIVVRLARLTSRNRWAMICIFGSGALIGQIVSVLMNMDEVQNGLSDYFPYDVICYALAAVGGYIAWRIQTVRLQRIKLEREARIKRRKLNMM